MNKKLDKTLICGIINGLGDRFISYASGVRLSRKLGRRFILWWPITEHCMASFYDLFEPIDGLEVTDESFEALIARKETYCCKIRCEVLTRVPRELPAGCFDLPGEVDTLLVPTTVNVILPDEMKVFSSIKKLIDSEIRESFTTLRPKNEIARTIQNFSREYFNESTISIHLRRTDIDYWYKGIFREDEKVINILTKYVHKYPNLRFFLASDSKETTTAIKEALGDRIITYPKTHWVTKKDSTKSWFRNIFRPKESVIDSIIEMYLLAETKTILVFDEYSGRFNMVVTRLNPNQKIIYVPTGRLPVNIAVKLNQYVGLFVVRLKKYPKIYYALKTITDRYRTI